MGVIRPRISYADLERAPEDGRRYELYDGEVYVVPAPLPRHQLVQQAIAQLLHEYAEEHGGFSVPAPIDVVFSPHDVLQPVVVYFRPERRHLIDLDRPVRHPPDLCVEVLSPTTVDTDRGRKLQMFARYGVSEYWIADPAARAVEIDTLTDDGYVLAETAIGDEPASSPMLPGMSLTARSLFPD